jgi:glucose/arabinose dehydrogenase
VVAPDAPAATVVPSTSAPVAEVSTSIPQIAYELVAEGFEKPLYLTHAGDGSGRLFVVEQAGVVKLLQNGQTAEAPFLDIVDRVGSSRNEQGLLSIAFHPRYAENGFLFASYTDKAGDTVISRFTAAGDAADPDSEVVLLQVDQPYSNHNGGLIKFGPDGFLYIGLGDGGSAGDPENRAQDLESLLGKMLRIDVDSAQPYAIPTDNPWAAGAAKPEIWAVGVRNPWRFSFDRATGDLYMGDVGQNKYEEINFQPARQAGLNYGWKPMEAGHCYVEGCDPGAYIAPIAEYPHEQGCSVTGGYVYRGSAFPAMQGIYFYGDYCSGTVWAMRPGDLVWEQAVVLEKGDARISSFGEDETGELYVIDHQGRVLRVVPAAS